MLYIYKINTITTPPHKLRFGLRFSQRSQRSFVVHRTFFSRTPISLIFFFFFFFFRQLGQLWKKFFFFSIRVSIVLKE
ncbi:hypothetical protein M6B38_371760 [Iris pallida]|uniref:Uncharacterized protein n=1 Tax=Iris pallida TaxID=29817 RepID=A0AAX6GD91_IRIPA|nr:hypothetical protein M6B38_371760 [Iris pallida]